MAQETKKAPLIQKITVVFTDMAGSSIFFKRYGNIAGRAMLDEHANLIAPIIREHGGVLVKTIGDSTLSYFLNPVEAVKATVKIQKRIQEYANKERPKDQIHVRIAVHHGEGVIEEKDIFGAVVNAAAKLLPSVAADDIYVTEEVRDAVGEGLPLQYERVEIDGEKVPMRMAFRLDWENDLGLLPLTIIVTFLKPVSALGKAFGNKWPIMMHDLRMFAENKDSGGKILEDGTILSWSQSLFDALEAALDLLNKLRSAYLTQTSLQNLPIQIVVHKDTTGCRNESLLSTLPVKWESLQPGNIYLTKPAFDLWSKKQDENSNFNLVSKGDVYLVEEKEDNYRSELFFPHKELLLVGFREECFYCGLRRHRLGACPSKKLHLTSRSIGSLGSFSLTKLAGSFSRVFGDFEFYCQNLFDLKESDLNARPDKNDLQMACHALFDLTEIFQLRFLKRIWQSDQSTWRDFCRARAEKKHEGGKLNLILDCIRVSQLDRADSLLKTLDTKDLKDYRLSIVTGFLNIETEDYYQALYHFERAKELSNTQLQKIYALFLIARVYEVLEDYDKSADVISRIFFLESDCLEAHYRKTVLLVKLGEYSSALSKLKNLALQQPDFFLCSLIDPQLYSIQTLLEPMLDSLLGEARIRANDKFGNAQELVHSLETWFDDGDEIYKDYLTRLEDIRQLVTSDSYAGYVEAENMGDDLHRRCNALRTNIQQKIRKEVSEYSERMRSYDSYWKSCLVKRLFKRIQFILAGLRGKVDYASQVTAKLDDPGIFRQTRALIGEISRDFQELDPQMYRMELVENAVKNLFCFGKKALLLELLVMVFGLAILPALLLYLARIYPDLGWNALPDVWPYQKMVLTIGSLGGFLAAGLLTLKSVWHS